MMVYNYVVNSSTDKILEFLVASRYRNISYKGVAINNMGLPIFLFDLFSKNTIRSSVHRLKKAKYVTFIGSNISITQKGYLYYQRRAVRTIIFSNPFKKNSPKNLLLFFDIPEKRKAEREWLRRQLNVFGYEMIQRSVWVGPSPLPRDFEMFLKKVKLLECIKFLKLAKEYDNKNNLSINN